MTMGSRRPSTQRSRLAAAAAAALLGLLTLAAAPAVLAQDSKIDVRLAQRAGKEYEVQGLFFVPASSSIVWSVLTDYARIPDFVPSMRESRVVETREDGTMLVSQEAVGGAFVLTKKVHVLLEVQREPERLVFTDRSGKDFDHYAGRWQTQESEGGTIVVYDLRAKPNFLAPGFLMRGALRSGARDLLDQVRAEILRRARGAILPLQAAAP